MPEYKLAMAAIYAILFLEISRRIAGWAFVGVSLVIGLYPLVAEYMPGLLYGLIHGTGGNILLILLVGVFARYIQGMAGLVVPAYFFLALSMAPAAIKAGDLNVLAVHMFIVYYAMIGGITPPVAPGAFVASTLSGSPPMVTAFTCVKLGIVLYFIPFFFVFNPSLIFQRPVFESIYLIAFCAVGITLVAGALEGYLVFVGKLSPYLRLFVGIAGLLVAFPDWKTTLLGFAICVLPIVFMQKKKRPGCGITLKVQRCHSGMHV